jgi:hypothetical protein
MIVLKVNLIYALAISGFILVGNALVNYIFKKYNLK